MLPISLSYAAYWRDSLADADLNRGGLTRHDLSDYDKCPVQALVKGQLDTTLTVQLFKGESDDTDTVLVELRPCVYVYRLNHGKRPNIGYPEYVTPLVTLATLDRQGRLNPHGVALVPRDILDPLDRGSLSIGHIDTLDEWLTRHPPPFVNRESDIGQGGAYWPKMISYLSQLSAAVTNDWPGETGPYLKMEQSLLKKKSTQGGASFHILSLYDHLIETKPSIPLFERVTLDIETPPLPNLASNAYFSRRLGHASDSYPLADAQRDTMAHHLSCEEGDILAVNGPPGTGKTTLVLSIIASHMVESALTGCEPKLIVATSTNNQAVTNIIDAFAKDFSAGSGPFAGRWLPDIHSYGVYLPSKKRAQDAARKYQTPTFFETIEDPAYVSRASATYLAAAKNAYPELASASVQEVVARLSQDLKTHEDRLTKLEACWQRLLETHQAVMECLGENPHQRLVDMTFELEGAHNSLTSAKAAKLGWEDILADEPWWLTLFSWLPAVAARRFLTAKRAFQAASFTIPDGCQSLEEITLALNAELGCALVACSERQDKLAEGKAAIDRVHRHQTRWRQKIALMVTADHAAECPSLAEVDQLADTHIRFPAFLLATHYWEGRWLMAMTSLQPQRDKKRTGRNAVTERWRRRMMLTPCLVSTCYMLPTAMAVSKYVDGDYVPDYLYGLVDLLIVDEAGQVPPEIASASFALAKTALVIGDTRQTAPIWNMTTRVDIGNLSAHGLLNSEKPQADYERLRRLGTTASAGSVMHIAQCASRYHYDPDMERGMFLYDHRRCVDEIISYCNELCYFGKLRPKRGPAASDTPLPAMGYLHIDGKCQQTRGGSRVNQLDADIIAEWLCDHRARLEAHYNGRDIAQIVAVVTPFGGQVEAIARACRDRGLQVGKDKGALSIGTINSMQGAERPIIIFSPTYSKHADGPFLDRSESMLNVAVSRAKDSFLVFGDIDLFNPDRASSPRGLLARYLFSRPENALSFKTVPRRDLISPEANYALLRDARDHDAFLLDALTTATQEVHIVSPWLRKRRMEETGLLPAMAQASARGVTVTVYADPALNQETEDHWQSSSEAFLQAGVGLIRVPRLHSKMVAKDGKLLCIGSFNWLSAARGGSHARHETSIAYSSPAAYKEIQVLLESLVIRQ